MRFMPSFLSATERTLLLIILVLCLGFSFASPYFFSVSNATDLLESYAVTTILAAGVFVVLVSGGIDISFAAIASTAQYAAAYAAASYDVPAVPTILIACGVGFGLGCINALLVHYLRVVSIIITIATAGLFLSLLITLSGGSEIYDIPAWWTDRTVLFRIQGGPGDIGRITLPIVVMFATIIITHIIMSYTKIGREIYAYGGNAESAKRAGVKVLQLHIFVYGYLGFLSGIAGLIQAHRIAQALPTAMIGIELNVIAVAVLGGASLVGGIGTMFGVALGVLLLAILQNGLNLIGVSYNFFQIIIGIVILLSISATAIFEKRQKEMTQQ